MTDKRRKLPMEGLVDPRERTPGEHFLDITDDVEGHGLPLPAPPAGILNRGTGHGGEALPTGDDRETNSR
jgi:hypothetical protein